MSQSQIIFYTIALFCLILLAAFFSSAETAVMAINRYRMKHKARQKKRYALRLLRLLKRPDRLLGTILIGSTFANILASSIATLLAFNYFGENGAILSAILLTIIILIFAEVTPKTLAALYPEQVVQVAIYPIEFFLKLLYPLVWLANFISNNMLKLLRIHLPKSAIDPLSNEELRSIVADTSSKVSRQYQNMLLSILDLNKLTVDDVMIPRYALRGINIEESWEKIASKLKATKSDWIVVYRENINQVLGILYSHDLVELFVSDKALTKETIQNYLQEPYFIPEGTSLQFQLNYFQKQQHKIAFVVDEYGEIQGMITLNNILEEIVGDFTSNVSNLKKIEEQKDGSYIVDGSVGIRDFNRMTSFELPTKGSRTINGLIVEHLQALPHKGTALLIAGHPVEILTVKENRVKSAKINPKFKKISADE